ncbi:hypothetical protein LX86_001387 [Lentzea aerocolonigenes]|nr:hypothetical protein [Lentzea aerocolonigenes]
MVRATSSDSSGSMTPADDVVCTLSTALVASSGFAVAVEVARAEKSFGMVTTAA